MTVRAVSLAAGAFALGLATAAAAAGAAEPAYAGTWSQKAAHCKLDKSQRDAPMRMHKGGFDQHETHCAFSSVAPKGGGWLAKAVCSVEGDKQKHSYILKVSGDRLTMTEAGRARTFRRCKG